MRIINTSLLEEFGHSHPQVEQFLKCWRYEVQAKTWSCYQDVLKNFPRAMIMKGGEAISFELLPNDCYIFSILHYNAKILVIKGIGSLHQILSLKNQSTFLQEPVHAHSSH
ncbi:MAG: type II toxin-antitoxin system HigB family toxin [Alphaproteobacteria bacterium]|nr:type II toxin-antitoxin system HigB family toxin [Alphaproteobacteria bacterium]